MNQQHAILHLSLIDGVGSITLQHIITKISTNYQWHDIYSLQPADWIQLGIKPVFAHHLHSGLQNRDLLDQELSLLEKHVISITTIVDADYPARLRSIYAPPPVLYYQGILPTVQRSLAFVGSRQANHYGKRIIEQLIPPLTMHFTIVSGGAIGADSMAHRATIAAGGTTIVVVGSGLLKPYPRQNKKLFEDAIAMGGAVISLFSPCTDPLPGNFVARNRVIAGLVDGVVVVQAAQKSGTHITAQFALDQGRDVFAVPGPFDDPLSAGCHSLIQQGAKLIVKVDDILQEYNIDLQKDKSFVQSSLPQLYQSSSIQARIITLCAQPQSIDAIAADTEKNLHELQLILFEMHMAGVLEQDFAGLWRAV